MPLRPPVGAHDGANEVLVFEHLAPLRTKLSSHVAVERSAACEAIHDLIHLGGRECPRSGLWGRIQQRVFQLDQVHLATVVIVEG